jgi:lysophospholipase L1-like esterase
MRIPARSVAIVECTLNDVRTYGLAGLHEYRTTLFRIFARLRSAAPRPRIVMVLDVPITKWSADPPYDRGTTQALNAYDDAARTVAKNAHVAIADPRVGWIAKAMISSDGVHPNPLGARHIAVAVERAMR